MFGIGIYFPKHECNIGTLFRSAVCFGANFVFTVGNRKYRTESSDTLDSQRHIPYFYYKDYHDFNAHRPNARLITIEIDDNAKELPKFNHPQQAIYLLGSEGGGLPKDVLNPAKADVVVIPSKYCLNLAVAGSIIMYDRVAKGLDGKTYKVK